MYDRIVVQGDNPYVVAYEYVQSWQSGTDESGDPIQPFADAEPVFEDPQG
jgi:Ribonuclease G/E